MNPHLADQAIAPASFSLLASVLMVPLCLGILLLKRRHVIAALIFAACFISDSQHLRVAGADFTPVRILLLLGGIRTIVRQEYTGVKWKLIDAIFVLYLVSAFVAYCSFYGTVDKMIYRIGELYTYAGLYLTSRCWLRSRQDVLVVCKTFAIVAIPEALMFGIEFATGRNPFALFGGVPELTMVRDGKFRCQGAFPHPLMAGGFWVGALPLILALWWQGKLRRPLAVSGGLGALFIIATTNSSTSILGVLIVAMGAALFRFRSLVPLLQICSLLFLLGYHFFSGSPVWSLVAKLNVVGGSTGWHRFHLIDAAISHFGEWYVNGTASTEHWGWGLWDVTNQYLVEGVRGGFLSMMLFIAVMTAAFAAVGRVVRNRRFDQSHQMITWLFGCATLAHAATFLSTSYFGATPIIYWVTIGAAIGMSHPPQRRVSPTTIYWAEPAEQLEHCDHVGLAVTST